MRSRKRSLSPLKVWPKLFLVDLKIGLDFLETLSFIECTRAEGIHFDLKLSNTCGRHFAAVERPEILIQDIREFFSSNWLVFNDGYRR